MSLFSEVSQTLDGSLKNQGNCFFFFLFHDLGEIFILDDFHYTNKRSFSLRISSVNVTKSVNLLTFSEEILNGKLQFLYNVSLRNKFFSQNLFFRQYQDLKQ